MARIRGRNVLAAAALPAAGFALLVLIGLWDRYEKEAATLGFQGAYERLAWEAGFHELIFHTNGGSLRQQHDPHIPKLVGAGALPNASQGASIALSADGNTAILGGPGPNNADRDRASHLGPAGAAWVFARNGIAAWTPQGGKLIGTTREVGGGLWSQAASVALSADGNTALIGGPSDNKTTGAVWVFTRSGGVWTQQGGKLVGTGASGSNEALSLGQGISVALSADGDTAIVGGWRSEGAWVFTRRDGVWTQQGAKLVGSGALGSARQGISVALSADGNTAIVGGWSDNNQTGAAWVFTRNKGVWTQQGKKLVGSGALGHARQGTSVALSADGSTAIVGGPGDSPSDRFGVGAAGAAWVFTRRGGVWTQQGHKLVAGKGIWTQQGTSVALSGDGQVAVVAGFAHAHNAGAATMFTRSGETWSEEKDFAGESSLANTAPAVAISADGSVVLLGQSDQDGGRGAALVFTRKGGGEY